VWDLGKLNAEIADAGAFGKNTPAHVENRNLGMALNIAPNVKTAKKRILLPVILRSSMR